MRSDKGTIATIEIAARLIEAGVERATTDHICEIARRLRVSHHHLHRTFHQFIGEPPAAYRRRISMHVAAFRLQWSREMAGRIGFSVGYQSQAAFTPVFTRSFGLGPTQYRQDYLTGHAEVSALHPSRFMLNEEGPSLLLGRRYVGGMDQVPDFWNDFDLQYSDMFAKCSASVWRVGLIYNDWRTDPLGRVRYDCCAAVSGPVPSRLSDIPPGLHRLPVQEARYAGYRFDAAGYDRRVAYRSVGDALFFRRSLTLSSIRPRKSLELWNPIRKRYFFSSQWNSCTAS